MFKDVMQLFCSLFMITWYFFALNNLIELLSVPLDQTT